MPLAAVGGDAPVALAGETALFGRGTSSHFRVLSVPVDGSARARELIREPGAEDVRISASPQRAAFSVLGPDGRYVLTGPPAGPFSRAPASPGGSPPYFGTVNHDVLFTVEPTPNTNDVRYVVIEPGAPPRSLGLPGSVDTVAYEGDLVAYASEETRVTIRNWRTGAERTVDTPARPDALDVRADGAVVVSTAVGIYAISPAGALSRVSRTGQGAQFAGERIVYLGGDRRAGGVGSLIAVDAGGRARKIGVPSATLQRFAADEERVLWTANGCLLVAALSAPQAGAPGAGPCARSEVAVIGYDATIRRDRTVPVRLRCVAAPRACRGTLHLTFGRRASGRSTAVRFSIPAGRRATLAPRLTRAAYAAARRRDDAPLAVDAVTVDPGGRRHRFTGGLTGRVR